MSERIYSNSKEKIINAALGILASEGMRGLTTEAVIKQSGLSKAGFFYNFKTKQDLVKAICVKLETEWASKTSKYISQDPNPTGRELRAYMRSLIEEMEDNSPEGIQLSKVLFELVLTQPQLLGDLGELGTVDLPFDKSGSLSQEQVLLVTLALDGLWVASRAQHLNVSDSLRKRTIKLLAKLTEQPLSFLDEGATKKVSKSKGAKK